MQPVATAGALPAESGLVQWAFNVAQWEPSEEQFKGLLELLPAEEQARIRRFHFLVDAKRSCIGQILARLALNRFLPDIQLKDLDIRRTEHGKPYLASTHKVQPLFNISHHGDWVVVVAANVSALGVDVSRAELPANETVAQFFDMFKSYFTEKEWEYIQSGSPVGVGRDLDRLHRFHQLWCLKESYVKSIGIGLGLDLLRLSFDLGQAIGSEIRHAVKYDVSLQLDGNLVDEVSFQLSYLDSTHPVAVCYVPSAKMHEGGFQVLEWSNIQRLVWS
ncbi:4'-phosphopantetheinyl transferase superfamily [Gaertneriomyces semiglobifer]|nr:4'-phosphopantetheinyl transferase superfamily [Gaertneriomyces semiglobifer]